MVRAAVPGTVGSAVGRGVGFAPERSPVTDAAVFVAGNPRQRCIT
jgi:hypothetical protein